MQKQPSHGKLTCEGGSVACADRMTTGQGPSGATGGPSQKANVDRGLKGVREWRCSQGPGLPLLLARFEHNQVISGNY